ncbi:DUF6616 family protein [Salinimicrobium terrae]|uniref:DUF6616 family protein n=1 Tax=Salinimicrobium terrae TaxID=470866 RepID=UPI0004005C77|nr:DUF6616 family protein [Salinimicrobium terrae]
MYLYVEQWNVTKEWMDLSKEDRRSYMNKVKDGIQEMSRAGLENLGWALNDEHTPHRSDYRYFAIWKLPSLEAVEELEKGIEEAGWHKYFSQVNSRGKIIPFNEAIDFLVNLEKNSTSILD